MSPGQKTGILLINTGSPDAPTVRGTRVFLEEFLSDPYVMDIPAPMRWLLLHGAILPFRAKRSSEAYQRIWTPAGSPLRVTMEKVRCGLTERLAGAEIAVGMRYGNPSIPEALAALLERRVSRIVAAPLFPQYAAASTGSALNAVYRELSARWNVPPVSVLPPFYAEPGFIASWAAAAQPVLDAARAEHVVLSYHGLPERHVRKSDVSGGHCLRDGACCDVIGDANRFCYRAHCMATSRALAARLGWSADAYTVSFQSRLGRRTPWLQPATSDVLAELPRRGVKRVTVLCPSFVVDCLETLEEIGEGGRALFLGHGGEVFALVPSLNDNPPWLDALAAMLGELAGV